MDSCFHSRLPRGRPQRLRAITSSNNTIRIRLAHPNMTNNRADTYATTDSLGARSVIPRGPSAPRLLRANCDLLPAAVRHAFLTRSRDLCDRRTCGAFSLLTELALLESSGRPWNRLFLHCRGKTSCNSIVQCRNRSARLLWKMELTFQFMNCA